MKILDFAKRFAVLGVLGLAACSGGGSSGPATAQSSSIVTYGAITAFGSVYVNGTHYGVTNAVVTDGGKDVSVNALQVGETVRLQAEDKHDGSLPEALRIDRDAAVEGPISPMTIDTMAGTFEVLGQTISVGSDTLFDNSIQPASLAGLTDGEYVEVDGFIAADGSVHATRIEPAAKTDPLRVTGKIAALDSAAKTFTINNLTVLYDTATLSGFDANGPANGNLVEAQGASLNASMQLVASNVALRRFDDQETESADHVEVEGLVTNFVSATDFTVNDQEVTTNASTQFEGGAAADIALNVKLEVEGKVDSNGVLVADRVNLRGEANVAMDGDIDAIDTTANTLTMLGITVSVSTFTGFDDRSPEEDRYLSLSKLHVGDHVEIRGVATSSNEVQATRLERRFGTATTVSLRGPSADLANNPDFTILGTKIATTTTTQFENTTAADFFKATTPPYVAVSGTWDGTTLTADKVTVETEAAMHH